MADVTEPSVRRAAANRGQLILVTALSLAILFVALALIVNTAIYTENLATRSSDIGGGTDAVRFHDASRDSVTGTMEYINTHNNTTFPNLNVELREGVEAFQNRTTRLFATSDRSVRMRFVSSENGTQIEQTDSSREFHNASGGEDWSVATGVSNTRDFQMNADTGSLVDLGSDPFEVIVDDGTQEWRLTVSDPIGADVEVTVAGPTDSGSCTTNGATVWINVTEGTLGGEPCDVLTSFADGVSTPYEIRFSNGTDVTGTYSLIVDNQNIALNVPTSDLEDSPGSGQPFATHAVYSTTVTVTYETPRLFYNSTIRVAPGEPR